MQFKNLPNDVKILIYQYDPSGKDWVDKTIHQIKMASTLSQIQFQSRLGDSWYKSLFFSLGFRKQIGLKLDEEHVQRVFWNRFRYRLFHRNNV